jgi:pyridoxal phosphate enzyme (YggS family)
VKSADGFFLVHSIDSLRLAEAANSHATTSGRVLAGLIQVNVAGEETKGGFTPSELPLAADRLATMPGIDVRGVMSMAPLGASELTLRRTFQGARQARKTLLDRGLKGAELSMGMSDDYEVAVEEGATYVRLGTVLFGARA